MTFNIISALACPLDRGLDFGKSSYFRQILSYFSITVEAKLPDPSQSVLLLGKQSFNDGIHRLAQIRWNDGAGIAFHLDGGWVGLISSRLYLRGKRKSLTRTLRFLIISSSMATAASRYAPHRAINLASESGGPVSAS